MKRSLASKLISASSFLLLATFVCAAQIPKPTPATNDEKAETILQKAVQAMGGERYLNVKTIIGRGKFHLIDTRPAERNGDNPPDASTHYQPRNITWTHYYGIEDSYSRIDYILISSEMLKHWVKEETYIPTIPNWGIGSDHRPVVAGFSTEN